ncbi:MAG: hypothetical protein HZB68_03290 [Candidatus Aenigmarchaeota archaeon]|nr:hypothetical protein [Candidatus Aenigmarchaeota archaeon]
MNKNLVKLAKEHSDHEVTCREIKYRPSKEQEPDNYTASAKLEAIRRKLGLDLENLENAYFSRIGKKRGVK